MQYSACAVTLAQWLHCDHCYYERTGDKSVTTSTGPPKPKKVQRSASRSSAPGKRPLPPPPPNKTMSDSLPDQLKGRHNIA